MSIDWEEYHPVTDEEIAALFADPEPEEEEEEGAVDHKYTVSVSWSAVVAIAVVMVGLVAAVWLSR